jgi:hypothetical protein
LRAVDRWAGRRYYFQQLAKEADVHGAPDVSTKSAAMGF